MKFNTYYRTLDGNVGKAVSLGSLNHYLGETFRLKEQLTLVQLEFDSGELECWLSTQLVEVENPYKTLCFEEESE